MKNSKLNRLNRPRAKKTIDMITRLYIYMIKSDDQITPLEIEVLYSLLINLFKHLDVSWEVYVRRTMARLYDLEDVIQYLNKQLVTLDKIRIILSLIILANSDNDIQIRDLYRIEEICNSWELDSEPFVQLLSTYQAGAQACVKIPINIRFDHLHESLFTDYMSIGRSSEADMRFRDPNLKELDSVAFAIDKNLFLVNSADCGARLDGEEPCPSCIKLLLPDSILEMGNISFDVGSLWKIYQAKDSTDEISFKKQDYDFVISRQDHLYSLIVYHGSLSVNGKELFHSRKVNILYDDILQIKGYAPFSILKVIQERSVIGVDNLVPKELWLTEDKGFFYLSKHETDGSFALLEIDEGELFLHPPKRNRIIYLNQIKVDDLCHIQLNTDILTISRHNFRINSFYDLVETPIDFQKLLIRDIKHYFPDGFLALDSISFEVNKGELIGVLGQSGCGKSTLVKVITGELSPTHGMVRIDDKSLFHNIGYYSQFIGYVPQDDLLYPNLSVYENLWYRGRLRLPNISKSSLKQKIENLLYQVNLAHRKDSMVGIPGHTKLSGGERKRLNLALELLFEPTLIVCDEPTSGLSWGDAEQIIDILKTLTTQGKVVILTIHQPNSWVFRKFDNVLLMDTGGRQVFYGTPMQSFDYFDSELKQIEYRKEEIKLKKQLHNSDYMYEVISYPEYTRDHSPVYEQVNKLLQVKRKYPPEYWRDKFKRKMLLEIIQYESTEPALRTGVLKIRRRKIGFASRAKHLGAFIVRGLKMKLRNRTNNVITFVQAPLLGLVISFILRHTTTEAEYNYYDNNNIGIFIFVSIIAFIFMGLSNSVEEILAERKIVQREKRMNLKMSFYLISKLVALSLFSLIQVALYTLVSFWVLKIKGLWGISVLYFMLTSMVGFSLGLSVSSFLKDNKSIINLLPLLLIPQIIFGGAVIEFEKMNHRLTLYQKHPVPEVVQFIPSRWLFEGMATAYAKNTKIHKKMNAMEKKRLTYNALFKEDKLKLEEHALLQNKLKEEMKLLPKDFDPTLYMNANLNSGVGLMDGEYQNKGKNVFLSSHKKLGTKQFRTWNFNLFVTLLYVLGFNFITLLRLKFYFKE